MFNNNKVLVLTYQELFTPVITHVFNNNKVLILTHQELFTPGIMHRDTYMCLIILKYLF